MKKIYKYLILVSLVFYFVSSPVSAEYVDAYVVITQDKQNKGEHLFDKGAKKQAIQPMLEKPAVKQVEARIEDKEPTPEEIKAEFIQAVFPPKVGVGEYHDISTRKASNGDTFYLQPYFTAEKIDEERERNKNFPQPLRISKWSDNKVVKIIVNQEYMMSRGANTVVQINTLKEQEYEFKRNFAVIFPEIEKITGIKFEFVDESKISQTLIDSNGFVHTHARNSPGLFKEADLVIQISRFTYESHTPREKVVERVPLVQYKNHRGLYVLDNKYKVKKAICGHSGGKQIPLSCLLNTLGLSQWTRVGNPYSMTLQPMDKALLRKLYSSEIKAGMTKEDIFKTFRKEN